ncbi:MAG: carbon-nitrogen family hydrolase [Anaerolineae bacterium]|nr:carbon-nitrogen family hydrolase [Anaerolineae bacterium]
MRITLAQTSIIPGEPKHNFYNAVKLITQASELASNIIVLPELWSSGYRFKSLEYITRENDVYINELANISKEKQIHIAGSVIQHNGGRYTNSFIVFYPDGSPPLKYEKIHLFRLMKEDHWLSPGNELTSGALGTSKIGLAICYDLRFPLMFTRYMEQNVVLVLLCAEWPISRIDQWKTLLSARALENQYFLAAANAVGTVGRETFGGNSAVLNPWGRTLVSGDEKNEALLSIDIDLSEVERIRQEFPVVYDRRPDIYG